MGKLTSVLATIDLHLWEKRQKLSLPAAKAGITGICRQFHGGVPNELHPQFVKAVAFVDAGILNGSVSWPLLSGLYGADELIEGDADVPASLVRVRDFTAWSELAMERRKHMTAFQRRPEVDSRIAEAVINENVLIIGLGTRQFLGAMLVALIEEVGELAGELRTDTFMNVLRLGYSAHGKKGMVNRVVVQDGKIFPDVVNNAIGLPRRDRVNLTKVLAGNGGN